MIILHYNFVQKSEQNNFFIPKNLLLLLIILTKLLRMFLILLKISILWQNYSDRKTSALLWIELTLTTCIGNYALVWSSSIPSLIFRMWLFSRIWDLETSTWQEADKYQKGNCETWRIFQSTFPWGSSAYFFLYELQIPLPHTFTSRTRESVIAPLKLLK